MNEHYRNLDNLIEIENINNILDAGSGKTSLSYLLNKFPGAKVDAIIYPGDDRKKNSIIENVRGEFNLKEIDLCKNDINEKYDLVFAHLLLGEATKFGNSFLNLLNNLLGIDTKYIIIYDFKEDNTIDYKVLENYLSQKKFQILEYKTFEKDKEQIFEDFIGKNYVVYVAKKIN